MIGSIALPSARLAVEFESRGAGDDRVACMVVLSDRQRQLLDTWLGDWHSVSDLSWPLQETIVLHVRNGSGDHIVKASLTSHHIAREIDCHLTVLRSLDLPAARREYSDAAAGILVTGFVPGELVMGTEAEWCADVYRQAGEILSRLSVPGAWDDDYIRRALDKVEKQRAGAVGLVQSDDLDRLALRLKRFRLRPVRLHFTHGDYQPRNWLKHGGTVSVIDFGRGVQRSWVSDLVRLQNQQFLGHPELEEAFMQGLGRTLTEEDSELLALETLTESLGTVVWANRIGDREFEEHGRRMIARVLATD